jgi:DNA-binding CsgD family transcriptional regulator
MLVNLHSGYLTGRQLDIWRMLREGLSQSEIARRLNVSRQAVNKLMDTIPEKIGSALNDAAKLNRISPTYLDVTKGLLIGWSKDLKSEVVIAMGPQGLQVWYQHSLGECKICPDRGSCKSVLVKSAHDLRVHLKWSEKRLPPSELSDLIFSRASNRKKQ